MKPARGFAPILIVLVVLASIAVGVVGLFAYQKFSTKAPETTIQKSEIPNASFSPTSTPNTTDETANWKTYENLKYKYSVKYPQELDYQTLSRSQTADNQVFMNGENNSYIFPEDKFIGITIKVIPTDLLLDEYLEKEHPENQAGIPAFKSGLKEGKIQKVTIDAILGYKANKGMQFENTDKDAWFKKDGYIYWFRAFGNGETGTSYSEKAGIVFDQMLTTFKFTE